MQTCKSKYEHRHDDMVSGIFSSRRKVFPEKVHFLWDKDKGEDNPDTEFEGAPKGGRKSKKRFPWERW